MSINIRHILLLVLTLATFGCGDIIQCSNDMPSTWGCEARGDVFVCDEEKEFTLFEDTIGSINKPIKTTLEALTQQVLDSPFSRVVQAMLLLYITIYGVMIAGGLTNISLSDAIIRIMKIAIISLMFTETGIELYFDIVVKFALDGGMEILNWVSEKIGEAIGELTTLGNSHEEIKVLFAKVKGADATVSEEKPLISGAFVAVDYVLGQLISPQAFALYMALFFTTNMIKWFMGLCLIAATFFFIVALFRAVYIYIVSLLGRIFLLGLGGIFIIFLLFKRTQKMFLQKWFEQLLGYMFAPIFVFIFISLMSILINVVFLDMVQGSSGEQKYNVCRGTDKKTNIASALSFSWEFYEKRYGFWVKPADVNNDMNVEFFNVLVLLALAFMCWCSISTMDDLSTQLFSILPDHDKLGSSPIKTLNLRHNLKTGGKAGVKGGFRMGIRAGVYAQKKWENRKK